MLKAKIGDTLVLGLSHANLDHLRESGLPGGIVIKGAEIGLNLDIVIIAAEDERVMLDHFADSIGPKTRLYIDPKLKLRS